jgi:hypothetical protein
VHNGTDMAVLQAVTHLMGFKSKYSFSNQCYNDIMKFFIDLILVKHNMLKDLYQSEKIVAGLGTDYEKIDACEKNCMLFCREHKEDIKCMHCSRSRHVNVINEDGSVTTKLVVKQLRYIPITTRLKRLFLCEEMVQLMRWHKEGICDREDPDSISHPVDAKAWHAPDCFDPEFAGDRRSVCLGLSTNGFRPYNSDSTTYSCWPVFVILYNLPPNKYLKEGFILLALVILGPKEPRKQMRIFWHPLIEDLKELWQGVDAYDSHLKCRFNLCTAYLWSIHNYLAYGKFASSCVHGRLM